MATSSSSQMEDLSQLTVDQIREMLGKKGLPTTGKRKVLLERLANAQRDSKSNVIAPELKEGSNFAEASKEPLQVKSEVEIQEVSSIRRKARVLQMDVDALIQDILYLSQNASNKIKVQLRIERLTVYRENYLQLRNELIALVAEDMIEEELRRWGKILSEVDKAVDAAHEFLNKDCDVGDHSSKDIAYSDSRVSSNLKLPRIEFPKFNGDVLKFQNFWDQFEAAVHNNVDLPNVQKFTYLRSVLTGNALKAMDGYEVTGANYEAAVECLKHRYGRKRMIISFLVKSVIKMDARSVVNASSLRDLYDTFMNRTRALEALGEDPMSHGCILLPLFETKLPPQLLEKWELTLADTQEDDIGLELFFKFLNRQVVSKEAGERSSNGNITPGNHSFDKGKENRRKSLSPKMGGENEMYTASALLGETRPPTQPNCNFCKADHDSQNCPMFNEKSLDGRSKVEMEALSISKICNPLGPVQMDFHKNSHLQGLTLADSYPRGSVQVDVLIGADHYYSFVTGVCKRGSSSESLVAVESCLGWIVTGQVNRQSRQTSSMLTVVENGGVNETLKRFWELESIGIAENEDPVMSQEEECAVADFNRGLNFDGHNYEVRLPWKRNLPKLESNYAQALRRLESVERKLRQDPVKAKAYKTAINEYVEKGFAEEVPDQSDDNGTVRYLPHHAVFRDDKRTTKCRIVFDASAREGCDASLNDCILPGPPLQPNLASVLIRFRTHKIGLIADIEKMFLQVKLAPKDRDVHRYLWRDLQPHETPKVYRMQRLTFGVNASPFLAIATVHAHVNKYKEMSPYAVEEILQNMYVDDCLTGADTVDSTLKLQQEMSEIMMTAAFNLTKWASNSELVMDAIDPAKRASSPFVEFNSSDPLKALGVSWDLNSDHFRFLAPSGIISSHDPMSKRSLLSLASKMFDPLGLISPFTVRAKILFQELWLKGLQWDDPLDSDTKAKWLSWKSESLQLKDVTIPRCFGNGITQDSVVEVHGFGDASPKAYGAAVYIRIRDKQDNVSSQLVISNSRVVPIKKVSLPRLELLAAVVNARLLKFVVGALPMKVARVVCWSDSMVALHWIKGQSSSWKPFVANRVAEVQSTWDPECWRYCGSKENPADLLTRGLSCSDMISSTLWWNGPQWMFSPCEPLPAQPENEAAPAEACEEKRTTHVCTAVVAEPLIDMSRYGTWLKLIRVTAYVLRAVKLFKTKSRSCERELSADEVRQAEIKCCMWVQEVVYKEEFEKLKAGEVLPSNSRLLKLDPYYDRDDQVLRVGGRLQFADLPEQSKHQIILPHGHPEVAKMVQDVHKNMLHAGPETVLSTLRQKVWLTQGRREVKRVIRRCVACQRQRVGPCAQKMGQLPEERISCSRAFAHVGTDFTGPLYVKEGLNIKKAYVCIFTCASSRMVHLELTHSLTTDEFLQAFSRMTSRRGLCHTVWSDNAQTFKAASREIQKLYDEPTTESQRMWSTLDQDQIKSEFSSRGIKWKFITERSPWRGGWWERFCRMIKEPLRKVLGRALLTFSELNTLLVRIEGIINSRPLTAVSDDCRDPLPITPAHLAIGRPINQLPERKESSLEETSKRTVERYLYLQRLLNHYWKRWKQEYLHLLSVRNKWRKEIPSIRVGDIVLISDDNVPRTKWPLAKVERVYPGNDGLVRTATVRAHNSFYNRPVQRLHKLEIESAASQVSPEAEDPVHGGEKPQTNTVHAASIPVSKPNLSVVLPEGGQGGENVTARTRSGRVTKKPKRLDL
ncbi:uncharacterized protein [Montipora capricornis]|uniref:uncharacterized protein n=1 Tax=Montipora capricornis TaxID=246305 RepID=UPI0035F121C1